MGKLPKGLTFDEEAHEYRENGKPIVSTTQLLKSVGFGPQGDFRSSAMERGMMRGNIVHEDYQKRAETGERVCTEGFESYGIAMDRFIADHEVEFVESEKIMIGTLFGVRIAGTMDSIMYVDGERCLVDYKTSKAIDKYFALQLVIYALLYKEVDIPKFVLQVKENGQYAFVSAEEMMPGYMDLIEGVFEAYKKGETFEINQEIEESETAKTWFDLKSKEVVLKKDLTAAEKKLKKEFEYTNGGNKFFTFSYKRASLSEKLDVDAFLKAIDREELYSGADILEMILDNTNIKKGKSSYAMKLIPQEEKGE